MPLQSAPAVQEEEGMAQPVVLLRQHLMQLRLYLPMGAQVAHPVLSGGGPVGLVELSEHLTVEPELLEEAPQVVVAAEVQERPSTAIMDLAPPEARR
jgi:hypothetical protein